MKKIILLLFSILSLGIQAQVNLVPAPQKVTVGTGEFNLAQGTTIAYSSAALKPAAEYLQVCLQRYAKVNATLVAGKQGDIRLTTKKGIAKDGYQLNVKANGIDINAANYSGTLSAIATLNQLLLQNDGKAAIPTVAVTDAPRFNWRGFHLDVSRHFFTVDEVKEIIDLMALYKLNRFHWHLTDDQGWRIEIKKYPLLTEKGAWRIYNNQDTACMQLAARDDNPNLLIPKKNTRVENGDTLYGGYYTQDQIRDVVAYAKQRGIEIIPEIDMPGHFLSAIENYEGLSCFPTIGWGQYFTTPLCPGKQKVLDFCKDIWSEVFKLFPYEYVHVGGDEVRKETWKECPDCQKRIKENHLKNEEELQSWFIHQMEAFINKNGKKMMGWDEILEGGLSKTATVTWWRTWVPDAPSQVTAQGNNVIFCPGSPMYLSQAEEKTSMRSIYEYDKEMLKGMNAKQKQHVIGVQGNMWCEYIPTRERVLFQYFPRILALSELAWTKPELKDYEEFYSRLPKQFAMLHKLNVPFRTPSLDGVYHVNAFTTEGTMAVSCADPLATVRYTTDDSFPNKNSQLYNGPVKVDETTHFILRTFAPNGQAGEMLKADFLKQGLLEPVKADASKLTQGLNAAWYNYRGEKCREIHKAPFNGNYPANDVVIPEGVKGNIGLIITGYLRVPEDGVYTFSLMSDDGSWLKIDGNMVVDNDRPQSPHEEVSQQALKAGLHKIEVRYFDSNGGMLRLWVFDTKGQKMQPADIYFK
ncbi:hexosaminidase [Xylanibacter ruminicola]|uniref:beta-N-acetylhexosaminidase n=1 Tax=Xylanibacter ruminicola TaxID=839 RepID=A0A1M7DN40_XYLRU|nr:family 20 glycosylhydrolase [Xylanibacter ruminicola]SHL80944.1 hexosaminidase [Xylanibacter ruminicola]